MKIKLLTLKQLTMSTEYQYFNNKDVSLDRYNELWNDVCKKNSKFGLIFGDSERARTVNEHLQIIEQKVDNVDVLSNIYLNSICHKIYNCSSITSLRDMIRFIKVVDPVVYYTLKAYIIDDEPTYSKAAVAYLLKLYILDLLPKDTTVSPWKLSSVRDKITTQIFGPHRLTLPVRFRCKKHFDVRYMSEEQFYAFVIGFNGMRDYSVCLGKKIVTIDMIPSDYTQKISRVDLHKRVRDFPDNTIYRMKYKDQWYFFSNREFIIGMHEVAKILNTKLREIAKAYLVTKDSLIKINV